MFLVLPGMGSDSQHVCETPLSSFKDPIGGSQAVLVWENMGAAEPYGEGETPACTISQSVYGALCWSPVRRPDASASLNCQALAASVTPGECTFKSVCPQAQPVTLMSP